MSDTYRNAVFGTGAGAGLDGEDIAGDIDQRDADFFSAEAFERLILNKVVDGQGRRMINNKDGDWVVAE